MIIGKLIACPSFYFAEKLVGNFPTVASDYL